MDCSSAEAGDLQARGPRARRRARTGARPARGVLAGLPLLVLATSAAATPTVELFFTAHNGVPVAPTGQLAVLPGDQVSVQAVLTTGDVGARAFDIFLDYDSAATGRLLLDDAANVLPPDPVPGVDWITQNEPGTEEPGRVRFSSLVSIPTTSLDAEVVEALQNATFVFGEADLTVTNAILDGPATLFPDAALVLGVVFADGNVGDEFEEVEITASYGTQGLTLTWAPEPGTGTLVATGLLVLGVAARRRRRTHG